MNRRFKVLVSAYRCSPYHGSEAGVGWGWINAIAKYHDVWVITAEFHRKDIESEFINSPDNFNHLRFHYVPTKFWHYRPSKFWDRIEGSLMKPVMNFVDKLWQRDAFVEAKNLH